jgi:hypothetical protein
VKKYFLGVLTGFIVCTMLVSTLALANSPIKLIVNGVEVFSDVPPQIIDGRTMIPARPLAEALGAKVEWDAENNAVVVTGGIQVGAKPIDLEPVDETNKVDENNLDNNTKVKTTTFKGLRAIEVDGEIYFNNIDYIKRYEDNHPDARISTSNGEYVRILNGETFSFPLNDENMKIHQGRAYFHSQFYEE